MPPKVLIVHYDPRKRHRIRGLLEAWEYEVLEASDGTSAVLQAQQGRPDLILMYAPLPRLNAPEACQQIRQLPDFRTTPVVIFSDVYRGTQVRAAILRRFGATDFIEWPVADEVLRRKITEWLSPPAASQTPEAEAGLDPELERELRAVLAQWEATPASPPESPPAPAESLPVEASPAVPMAPPEIFQDVIAEVETSITDLAAEETLLLETGPGISTTPTPGDVPDERAIAQAVEAALRETESEPEAPPPSEAAPTVVIEPPRAGLTGEPEGTAFGPYVLLKRVATGGMAELFLAKKRGVEGFEKTLAIKRILPHMSDNQEFITMFIDEAKVAARLTHPNIVQIFDLGRIDGDYYIAMEYVHGKDLRAVLRRVQESRRTVPFEIAAIIAAHLCAALDYAHRARDDQGHPLYIVHRDVSPQNVLISYDGDIKLTDFGVAKAAVKAHVTLSGALKGKILYMSPEQASLRPVDARSDIYSLGVVLYESLAGRNPFYEPGDTEFTLLEKVRQARVPPIRAFRPDVPESLVAILDKALQPDPVHRYASARDMQRDLEDFLVQRGVPNSTLYVARFIRELFPEEAGPIDEIREKLRHLPRIEPSTPPSAGEGSPTVQVGPSPHVSPQAPPEAPSPVPTASRSFEEVAYLTAAPRRRSPTGLLVVLGALVVITGALTGIWLRRAAVRSPQATTAPLPTPASVPARPAVPETSLPSRPPEKPSPVPSVTPPESPSPAAPAPPLPSPTERPRESPPPSPAATSREIVPSSEEKKAPSLPSHPEASTPSKALPTPAEPKAPPTSPEAPPAPAPPPETPASREPAPPETPTVRPGDLVEFPDQPPVLVQRVPVDFPSVARAQRLSDTVVVRVLVDEQGRVADTQVLRYRYGILRDAALEAIRKYKFQPARHHGVPVKTWYTVAIPFQSE